MREVESIQVELGAPFIKDIQIDARSRDDIPALLRGLQHIYTDQPTRTKVFELLNARVKPDIDRETGRPGMALWQILVLSVLKQGLGCDYDRLQELANQHRTVREMLGHGTLRYEYKLQTVIDNVSLLNAELLSEISRVVVQSGHEVARKKPGETLRGRCDSFCVETDVHYPTDVWLLWDSMRCGIRESSRLAEKLNQQDWRQHQYNQRQVKNLFNKVRRKRAQTSLRVKEYLDQCEQFTVHAERTLAQGWHNAVTISIAGACIHLEGYLKHARRQLEQVERRLLKDEQIGQDEKVFSIFEPHTRWVAKGKAGCAVELGVPVCVVEDQYQFIVHHTIQWQGHDVDYATKIVSETQQRFADFRQCSFDRGFHSRANQEQLDEILDFSALPRKGKLSMAARAHEQSATFQALRKQHPAVESGINNLEQRGLDRVRSYGANGFERSVALSVLSTNCHRIGLLLQRMERKKLQRNKVRLRAAA